MTEDIHTKIKQAEAEITGERYCYNCAKYRPAAGFKKRIVRGRVHWKCAMCAARANPLPEKKPYAR